MIGLVIVFIVVLIFAFFIWGFFLPSEPKKQQPYFNPYNDEPYDLQKMEDDFWGYRGRNLTEEDLKVLFGESKPLTDEIKIAKEQMMKKTDYFPEVDDDLPF